MTPRSCMVFASLFAASAVAQVLSPDSVREDCTVLLGNQSGPLRDDYTFSVSNVPSGTPLRAQVICAGAAGGLLGTSSEFKPIAGSQMTDFGTLPAMGPLPELPVRLVVDS